MAWRGLALPSVGLRLEVAGDVELVEEVVVVIVVVVVVDVVVVVVAFVVVLNLF